ncbi:MAG: DUF1611 domain-containing protein [Cyclobacteriaceae bacterium]|nr:DUF1611 domain-containing protein [Cyclobacteriaceae bacterium]
MDGKAIILAQGMLDDNHAKTAHGLIRGTERYEIIGVIDRQHAGLDAGIIVDGIERGIPVMSSLQQFQEHSLEAQFLIIGVATKGGYIPDDMRREIREAVTQGLSIVNGLHEFLGDDPELSQLAAENNVRLIDIRKPRPKDQLQFWNGSIAEVLCPKIAVLGTDCAIGKRTTARMLMEAAKEQDLIAEMIYTGQTGWLQGGEYGFIFDSTYNDFVSGELEHAIVNCYREMQPHMIFLEGQAALQNPTGPCGPEFLISARTDGVILQHAPGRKYFGNQSSLGEIPPLINELELIRLYGSTTLAIAQNNEGLTQQEADQIQKDTQELLNIPVVQPLKDGVGRLITLIQETYDKD